MIHTTNFRQAEAFDSLRFRLILGTLIAILIGSGIIADVFSSFLVGVISFFVLTILFFWNATITFTDNPPTGWIPEVRGNYVNELRSWGPTLLPWPGALTINATPMPGGVMHVDFDAKEMIPDDRVTVVIRVHLFYEVDRKNPAQVILIGGIDRAAELLVENLDKLLRQWVTHPEKGPEKIVNDPKMTLDRVRKMPNEAINYLLEELAWDDIARIDSDLPVEALMGYFEGRPALPREEALYRRIENLSPTERDDLRAEVKARIANIDALRMGNMPISIQSAGLTIRMLIVDQIEADGLSAAAIVKVAEANFNKEIKGIEATALADQARILKDYTTNMDPVQAALILQDKIKQTNQVTKIDASQPLLDAGERVITTALENIFNRNRPNNP